MPKNVLRDMVPNKRSIRDIKKETTVVESDSLVFKVPTKIAETPIIPKAQIIRPTPIIETPKIVEKAIDRPKTTENFRAKTEIKPEPKVEFKPRLEIKPELKIENKIEPQRPPEMKRKIPRTLPYSYSYDEGDCEVEVEGRSKEGGGRNMLWFVALISIGFLFFAVSSLFAQASITVTPKIENFVLDKDLSAFKDSQSEGVLSFDLVSLSGEESTTVKSGEEKEVFEKAKGKVILYNNWSASPQKLAIDTRLEGSNGKIYKTETEVTIPGIVKKDVASGITADRPGSIEVGIYALEEGEEYDSKPLDFKILGFKGTPKYDKLYGRSNSDISGGLKGTFSFVSEEDKKKAEDELRNTLEEKLLKKIVDQLPEGYILFKNATVFKIDDENINLASKEDEVPFTIKGTLYGFLFQEEKLTKKIVEIAIPKHNSEDEVFIPNIKDLEVSLSLPAGLVSFSSLKDIDFNLTGTSKIVWSVDEDEVAGVLLGKSKKDFNQILSEFSNIDSANLTLRPLWRRSIPSDSKDIKITINNEQ